ncbi:MAG: OsmC family protein [Alphaproteobacteria bacterium]|nr:OsmC family protein [Alphaproteobacteria bacterium]
MVTIRPKTVVTMKLQGACTTDARTDVTAGDLTVVVDEPIERGGSGKGLSPTQTMLAALLGCTNRIGHKVADANGVDLKDMSIAVEAKFDRRGVNLDEEIDVPFPEIKLTIAVTTDADDAAIEKVKTDLHRFCPISKVIREAGTTIVETWTVTRP